ncbi:unnamed protein product, partial [Sphacelaria rigidula]
NLVVQDSTTSNNAESTISMVGAGARALDPFHVTMAIAEQTAERLATHAELKKDSADALVPFAKAFIENERKLSLMKYVQNQGLGVFTVQEHGDAKHGNRVTIQLPDADGKGAFMDCTCRVPSRWKLLCCDAIAALKSINRLDAMMAFVDRGYTLKYYREVHSNPEYRVVLPIWSELSESSILPPRPVEGQAGAPRKGPAPKARIRGRNDNCQRGRGGGGGSGNGGGADVVPTPPVHGVGNVRSFLRDIGLVGSTGAERPAPRVLGPLAVQRYGSQAAAGARASSSGTQDLSQGSIDLT